MVWHDGVGYDESGEGGAERESRFLNLLQPNRDLATNWAVDVGTQLEGYLAELSLTGLFNNGQCSLNFAEAALLIQGSTQVYSRKVEYLYALVMRALEFIAQKKQSDENLSSKQADGQPDDVVEEKEEEFLNLDDIPEEEHIDILDGEVTVSVNSAVKIPASLLAVEAEPVDISGEAGELATYEIATSIMHRTFLLLDPCDTETVDQYLDAGDHSAERGKVSVTPGCAVPVNTPRSQRGTPGRGPGSTQRLENHATPCGGPSDDGDVGASECDWRGQGGATWDETLLNELEMNEGLNDKETHEFSGVVEEGHEGAEKDDYSDPWAPFNPHEPGDLPVKPFRKGDTQKKKRAPRRERSAPVSIATRTGVCFPEFAKALQVRERLDRAERRREGVGDSPLFEDLRNSFRVSDADSPVDAPLDMHEGLGGSGECEDEETDNWEDAYDTADNGDDNVGNAAQEFHPPGPNKQPGSGNLNMLSPRQDPPSFEEREHEGMSFEELCRAHLDSILQKLAESHVRTGLASRVTSWKNKIEATLTEQDARPPFDIHQYGDRLLAKLSTIADRSGEEEAHDSFTHLVGGQDKDQIARSFSALLQLVNNGNVVIDKGGMASESYCFTGENPFVVKLLSSQSRHVGMFKNMISSKSAGAAGRSKTPRHQAPARSGQDRPLVVGERTPAPTSRARSFAVMSISPASTRRSGLKRGQSITGKHGASNKENTPHSTPLHRTPVKLTPDGRPRSKRNPLQKILP